MLEMEKKVVKEEEDEKFKNRGEKGWRTER